MHPFFYPQKPRITAINKSRYMRLTIKAIIRWEQLNNKPFSQMSYSSEDEIIALFYACSMSDENPVSLSEFRENLQDDKLSEMIADFEKQTFIMSQFRPPVKKTQPAADTDKSEPDTVYIKDIVPMLVMAGLDVDFAFDRMNLSDIHIFLDAYDRHQRHRLESDRLWTFIQVSPHLSKRVKTPKDLHIFPWEAQRHEIDAEKEINQGKNILKAFFNTGKDS